MSSAHAGMEEFPVQFLLFATLKLSRDTPATLQQDQLTLLTVPPLPSINRADRILTAGPFQGHTSDSWTSNWRDGRTGTTSYLPDAVRDGPGEEDPRQDLEPGQHDGRRHNSWKISQVEDGNPCPLGAWNIRNTACFYFERASARK